MFGKRVVEPSQKFLKLPSCQQFGQKSLIFFKFDSVKFITFRIHFCDP